MEGGQIFSLKSPRRDHGKLKVIFVGFLTDKTLADASHLFCNLRAHMQLSGNLKLAKRACNWEKRRLDRRSCPFVFKWEKRSMDSIKQICERSKWLQSLLPAPQILAFNDRTRPADRDRAVDQMEAISCNP